MLMNHHVAAYLPDVEAVIPDFEQTDRLVCYDVEDKDVKRVVADIGQCSFEPSFMSVEPLADVIGHQES